MTSDAPDDVDCKAVLSHYLRVLEDLRAEAEYAKAMQTAHPDNCAWGNLVLKSSDLQIRALKELADALGLGKLAFLDDCGMLCSAMDRVTPYRD